MSGILKAGLLGLVLSLTISSSALSHHVAGLAERLPNTGPATEFRLIAQNGEPFSLRQTRGKVVAVSFTYTGCADTCPLLTSRMVAVQNALGRDFATEVFFVTVTMDPESDRPQVLKNYADTLGCNLKGWVFLTGSEAEIASVARNYGIYRNKRADGEVNHTLLTTIIDRAGNNRVQYIGSRFDPDEFLHDLRALIGEDTPA